jgi:three-Cys-motif partner protein
MAITSLKFDEIGDWSELKLEIVEEYCPAYTTAFANNNLKKYYIDAFCGAGVHVSKKTGLPIEGSPARALRTSPPFDGFYFIDLEAKKTSYLQGICGEKNNVHIHTGDATEFLVKTLLPQIQYKAYKRALCLLDPYGLHLDWQVIYQAAQSKAIDMFLNFPVMDMNRNAIWRNPENVPQDGIDRMNSFWGDQSWQAAAYDESPQGVMFGEPEIVKQGNDAIAAAFMKRLKTVAGFEFVPEPVPMKNQKNAVVYYLFFASQKPVAQKIITAIFDKHRQ